jgi:hypothetical protein
MQVPALIVVDLLERFPAKLGAGREREALHSTNALADIRRAHRRQ